MRTKACVLVAGYNVFVFPPWHRLALNNQTIAVRCLQEGLPGRAALICPSAPQFSEVSLGRPMRKISPHREPASHLKNDSLHSLSSPCSPRSSDTHVSLSPLFSYLRSHEQQSLPLFCLSHAFWVTHTQPTRTSTRSFTLKREREEETVKGGHSWRNVSCVTVTFDGDECESAAVAQCSAVASRPSGFAAFSSDITSNKCFIKTQK